MIMKRINIMAMALLGLAFCSCKKEINIDLNASEPQTVINGNISNEPGPYYVTISKTVKFSDANSYPPVSGALVIISDNTGIVDTLSEASPGKYQTHFITGIPGNTYRMKVLAEGKYYYATSAMPSPVNLDSIRFETETIAGKVKYMPIPVFTDPATPGNNYRFIQTVNSKRDKTYFVQNDIVTNGTVNQISLFSPDFEIIASDSVMIEMRCIDLATYNYYFTLAQISGGFGGQTAPSNPPNNITGDYALGLFEAYTTQKKTQLAR
jgi:hypothetical protein